MNCETIDAILDEHRTARLDQPERQAVATHLGGCARCAEGWAAHDALLGESMGEPSPELIARAFRRVSERHAPARTGSRRSIALAAVAAVAAVGVIAATFTLSGPDSSRERRSSTGRGRNDSRGRASVRRRPRLRSAVVAGGCGRSRRSDSGDRVLHVALLPLLHLRARACYLGRGGAASVWR